MKPIFSFIIPTFNRADIICEALESVRLEQKKTGFDVEVLIADDFSNDATQVVVQNWCKKENIAWVFYERLPSKGGVCAARNNGVNRSKGEYLIFLDSDDQILPDSLTYIKSVFEKQQLIDVYYGAIFKKTGRLGVLPASHALQRLLNFEDYVALQGVGEYLQVCRSVLLASPNYRFCEQLNGFETYLWMQVLREGAKLWIDPRPVRLYDDLRTDRLCHPHNLLKDSNRLALGFLEFFKEFGTDIQIIEPRYSASLLLRVIFYHKVSKQWNAELHSQLKPAISKSTLKVRVLSKLPGSLIRFVYPLFNRLRNSQLLNKLE